MPLSVAMRTLLDALRSSDFASSDVCTACSQGILDELGTGATKTVDHKAVLDAFGDGSAEDGIYELRMDLGNAQAWQHGLVLVKLGAEVVLLQGWVKRYRLLDWLDPHNGGDIDSRCFEMFSPVSATFASDDMPAWLTSLATLHIFYGTSYEDFADRCGLLFGVRLDKVDKLAYGFARNAQSSLHLAWRYRHLDPRTYA
jgi:hypothetical protein